MDWRQDRRSICLRTVSLSATADSARTCEIVSALRWAKHYSLRFVSISAAAAALSARSPELVVSSIVVYFGNCLFRKPDLP